MASQHIQAVAAPSKDAILHSILENNREYNARQEPGIIPGCSHCHLEAKMPFLSNWPDSPLPCREPAADFEAVNAHFSA